MRVPGNRPGRGLGPGRHAGVSIGLDPPIVSFINPNAGRLGGGLAVTINGKGFQNRQDGSPPVVTINGVVATNVVVVNSITITALTGVATEGGLGSVVVTIDGLSGSFADAFTYYTSTIISVSPPFGPISGGTSVMINGNNFLEGSAVTFDGLSATEVVFIDEQHLSCKTPAHAIGFTDVSIIEPL